MQIKQQICTQKFTFQVRRWRLHSRLGQSIWAREIGNLQFITPTQANATMVKTPAGKATVPSPNGLSGSASIVPTIHRPSANSICPDPTYSCPGSMYESLKFSLPRLPMILFRSQQVASLHFTYSLGSLTDKKRMK